MLLEGLKDVPRSLVLYMLDELKRRLKVDTEVDRFRRFRELLKNPPPKDSGAHEQQFKDNLKLIYPNGVADRLAKFRKDLRSTLVRSPDRYGFQTRKVLHDECTLRTNGNPMRPSSEPRPPE